jgi:hypothetical protein
MKKILAFIVVSLADTIQYSFTIKNTENSTTSTDRRPAYNSGLAKVAEQCLV